MPFFFFFNDTATTEIYTLSLHDALPIFSLLDTYEYFDSRILVHTDPAYAHRDRVFWSSYNAAVDGAECEGSAWLGPLHEKLASGATVDVFKSWAQRRRADPTNILLERRARPS